jgi:hypothetical protein
MSMPVAIASVQTRCGQWGEFVDMAKQKNEFSHVQNGKRVHGCLSVKWDSDNCAYVVTYGNGFEYNIGYLRLVELKEFTDRNEFTWTNGEPEWYTYVSGTDEERNASRAMLDFIHHRNERI